MKPVKYLRKVFGKRRGDTNSVACQAVLTDSERVSYSARKMRKTNNDILCVYEYTQDIEGLAEQLKKSEELVDKIADSFAELENMVERACKTLSEKKENIEKKRETLTRLRDVEDSKDRMSCVRKSSVENQAKSAEDRTSSSLMSSVREEREDLEHRSAEADMALQKYTVENLEDELVITSVQHLRQSLQRDHNSRVLQLQKECANFEKKSAVLRFQQKYLNTNQGKTELLTNFRVPKEEQEHTMKRFASMKKRKEALLERIQGHREKKRSLRDYTFRLRESIKKKKAMLN